MQILSIRIRNFRSIREAQIDLSKMNIFVWKNDAWKSNYLRALNLFFTWETEPWRWFNFYNDYCESGNRWKGKAKQVLIEITVRVPESYKSRPGKNSATDYPNMVWRKIWRENESTREEFLYRSSNKRKKDLVLEGNSSYGPGIGRFRNILKATKFYYIPANKSSEAFSRIVDTSLMPVLLERLQKLSSQGLASINAEIKNLTWSLTNEIRSCLNNFESYPWVDAAFWQTLIFWLHRLMSHALRRLNSVAIELGYDI